MKTLRGAVAVHICEEMSNACVTLMLRASRVELKLAKEISSVLEAVELIEAKHSGCVWT